MWQVNQDDKLREHVNSSYIQAQMENLKGIRGLIINFITISAGIIGFTIPVIGKTDLVRSSTILIGGLSIFLVVILYGLYYLQNILGSENQVLAQQIKRFNGYIDKVNKARNKYFMNSSEATMKIWNDAQKEVTDDIERELSNKKEKKDYALDILYWGFFLALIMLVLSLTEIESLV